MERTTIESEIMKMQIGDRCVIDSENDYESSRDITELQCVPGGLVCYRHIGSWENVTAVFIPLD